MWEAVVDASLWISADFQYIWVEFLHVHFCKILLMLGLEMLFGDGELSVEEGGSIVGGVVRAATELIMVVLLAAMGSIKVSIC